MTVTLIALSIGVLAIILLTTRYAVHPFFALLAACFIVGMGIGLPAAEVLTISKDGFGNILKNLGFIIVLGTTLGVILEHTGGTQVMASYLIKKVGYKQAPFAMSLTGFIVGLPIFCDSGFIVLSGLNHAFARRAGIPMAVMAVSMATGLYAVHCLIPPHPGATAAAVAIGVDFGKLILIGILVAVPAMLVGYFWAVYAGKKATVIEKLQEEKVPVLQHQPSVKKAFLPILVPIVLIAMKSFFTISASAMAPWLKNVLVLGDPVFALFIGVLLAFYSKRRWRKGELSHLLADAVEKAGGILVIIGAGGAFGAVLTAAKLGAHLESMGGIKSLGLLTAFLLTFILKTAQGSSTVAIITAASIIQPLLPALGIKTEMEKLLAVLSMGAGSMMISHANDAYFWVIAKFADLPVKTLLKVYSVATVLMGLTSMLVIYIIYLLL